jgi:MSHA biogenesis protein MshP
MIKQTGFSLIGAIFILVIVSLLGQYLLGITGVQRQTSLLALQSARAYQTANAGLEWAAFQTINNDSCPIDTTLTINNFSVAVSCRQLGSYDENGFISNIYQITSQSEYSTYGNLDFVSRRLQAVIHD